MVEKILNQQDSNLEKDTINFYNMDLVDIIETEITSELGISRVTLLKKMNNSNK